MKVRYIILIALLLATVFPRFQKQGISYQRYLWTSEWMKETYPSYGFLFKIGEVEGALVWDRLRLGFPLGAITIDSRLTDKVVQGRVETGAIIFNSLIAGVPATCIILLILLRRYRFRIAYSNAKHTEQIAAANLDPPCVRDEP